MLQVNPLGKLLSEVLGFRLAEIDLDPPKKQYGWARRKIATTFFIQEADYK